MPKPTVQKLAHLNAEEERDFYRSLTAHLSGLLFYDGLMLDEFREEFEAFRADKADYRRSFDAVLKRVAPEIDDLSWRDFRWLRANKWRQCPVCNRLYIDYSNGKGVACYLDAYVRWSKEGQRWIADVNYRGRVNSVCRAKYDAWKRRGRTGAIDFVLFNGTRQ
ncbi:hypothetical protein [Shouchella patagoniensis]|uniref:hypothetical protein n=1 Tax=Shouchella patagoniensis TaxID=228576 RepID=UPI000995154B|nr:hypothetical protein [Shouchella patagoniensis]